MIGDVAANLRSAAEWCDQAAEAGVELVAFPEAWNTGYDTELFESDLPSAEDLSWLAPVQEAVDRTRIVALLNAALSAHNGRKTLTTIVLAPGAGPRPAYDKQHLFALEVGTFTPGDIGASITLGGHEIALSVCYDVDFPEHAAAAAADGATIYVNSGLYLVGSEQRRDLRHAAGAVDNGMYVVFSGVAGEFAGGSAIYDPLGQPLSRLGREDASRSQTSTPRPYARPATRSEPRPTAGRRSEPRRRRRPRGCPSDVIALGKQLRDNPEDFDLASASFEWMRRSRSRRARRAGSARNRTGRGDSAPESFYRSGHGFLDRVVDSSSP